MTAAHAPLIARAGKRLAAGDIAGARDDCTEVLKGGMPQDAAAAHLVLSACARRAGDLASAREHVDTALRFDPNSELAYFARAEFAEDAGDVAAAIDSLERAVRLQPAFAAAHERLGILLGERGETQQAVDALSRAVALDPRNARAHNNLGSALRALGRFSEARAAFERAVALRPGYDLAIANVALMLRDAGEIQRAEAMLRAALARRSGKPPLRAMVVMLAGLLRERGALDEAELLYKQAIAQAPAKSAGEWFNLGRVYAERDEVERAADAYRRSYQSDPKDLRGALASRLSLPMIYADAADVAHSRDRFAEGLAQLHATVDRLAAGLAPAEALDGIRWTNFFLAYQGRDDRELQASYAAFAAAMVTAAAPQWRAPLAASPTAGRRLRVGFASAFFHVGTAGRYFESWITDLPRERFEVFVYHLRPGLDDVARAIEARAERSVEFGGSRARPSVVAPAIRADGLDVLVYPELGMDHTSFALAALRLAPRQVAGWGHPVTSGHATIDAFVSCDAMEPAGADAHYAERLHRLPGIGTRYRQPALPDRAPRARYGLPDGCTLLLCPQSLFKVHPDSDALFARVLAANPQAALVMFDGRHPRVTERFMRRITRAFDAHGISARERLHMLPAVAHDDYLRVNLACDAMLDTLHWSGGNTSLDAIACGLPVVTLPGSFMRGRQSAAMLRLAGVPELIAEDLQDYVRIATRLVGDAAWRDELAVRLREGRSAIFDTAEPVKAFADWLAGGA